MTEPWEIDPTNTDGNRDGAEGGAVGGDSAGDTTLPPPLQPPQEVDRTNPFNPTGGTSTPYPSDNVDEEIELTNMNLDDAGWDFSDVPLLKAYTTESEKETAVEKVKRFIRDQRKRADFSKIGPIGWGKRPENREEIVVFGPKGGKTRIVKQDGSGLLKSFTSRFKKPLGPSSEEILAEENQEVREARQVYKAKVEKIEKQKRMEAIKKSAQKLLNDHNAKIEKAEARLASLQEEDDPDQTEINRLIKLIKNLKIDRNRYEQELITAETILTKQGEENVTSLQKDADKQRQKYQAKVKERNETEAGLNKTKPLDELDVDEETLKRRIKEAKEIVDDENATSEQKQAARDSTVGKVGKVGKAATTDSRKGRSSSFA